MSAVMQIISLVDGTTTPFDGEYVVMYDPEHDMVDPRGDLMQAALVTSPSLTDAKRFADKVEAFEFWRQVSKRFPKRPWDGKPNRPLTAFTVSIFDPEVARVRSAIVVDEHAGEA